jgi:adenylate cyclase
MKYSPDEFWRLVLTGTHPAMSVGRKIFKHIPSSPRCRLCYSPFEGIGGWLMKKMGKGRWERNPGMCRFCFDSLAKTKGGTELEMSLLFADLRGSTALAGSMAPRAYGELINCFFETATDVIVRHDGIIDQLVGDEVVGLFLPGYAGDDHARKAVDAGRTLIERMQAHQDESHRLPIGIGIHTGLTYIGAVGSSDTFTDFTVLGDSVNTVARLASAAAAGEVLVSDLSYDLTRLDTEGTERRELTLKGKAEPFGVRVLRPAEHVEAAAGASRR